MKIHPVGADLFHENGQTDRQTAMTKLIVPFLNFANAPKMVPTSSQHCKIFPLLQYLR